MQLVKHPHLVERVLYTWADLYQEQLQSGKDYTRLRPVISVWILERDLLRTDAEWHHCFQVQDAKAGILLSDHLEIHTVELKKFTAPDPSVLDDAGRWLYFLREARNWTALPSSLNTPEMRKAMSVIERWSERDADYDRYRAREDGLRVKRAMELGLLEAEAERARIEAERARIEAERSQIQAELVAALAEKQQIEVEKRQIEAQTRQIEAEKAQAEAEKAQAEAEKAQADRQTSEARSEIERLRALLRAAGLDT